MPADFAVIIHQRHHFGSDANHFGGGTNFVEGRAAKDFPFDTPDVDRSERAVLMFQTRDVDGIAHLFEINGSHLFGGIPISHSRDDWNGNIALVEANVLLADRPNSLLIQSRNSEGGILGDLDNFLIDNVVLLYKTRDADLRARLTVLEKAVGTAKTRSGTGRRAPKQQVR